MSEPPRRSPTTQTRDRTELGRREVAQEVAQGGVEGLGGTEGTEGTIWNISKKCPFFFFFFFSFFFPLFE